MPGTAPKNPSARTVHAGRALPYGASPTSRGTNFAIYARETTSVALLLTVDATESVHPLDPSLNRTGHVWHVELVPPVPAAAAYAWRVGRDKDPRWRSNVCLDPWATVLDSPVGPAAFNDRSSKTEQYSPRALVAPPTVFDWQDVAKPRIAWKDMVIYELHVRGFSKRAPDIGPTKLKGSAGSFVGVVERIPYLKSLGVNVVELLPVMEYNEREWSHINPESNKPLSQYWGYSTVAFFAPMNRFGRDGSSPAQVLAEFKYMVRELHREGIEVILDVVYNHTAEMGLDFVGPGFYGMKTLAPFSYYVLRDGGHTFVNHSGCGNTVNSNNPATQELICASLRYWAHEMGVDGFRFDLASILCRGVDGEPLADPPIIERMTKDPTMRDVKLIAEPWDCGGLYQVGTFPHFGVWAEWNGKFRDCVRRFVKGDGGMIGEFATRLCGSQDLYGDGRKPFHSINFITAHDGFSMHDLVAYDKKHNHQNGENNNDGEAHNNSWNCGAEGDTSDGNILALRRRQMKNMLVALLVAAGTPMLTMGDEYGHTKKGNNNGWCQDSELTWFDWGAAKADKHGLMRFTSKLVRLRRSVSSLQHDTFLSDRDIAWHGSNGGQPDWKSSYNFLAMSFKGACEIYVAFNAGGESRDLQLPHVHGGWERVIDSNLEPPKDFADEGQAAKLDGGSSYKIMPFSCLLLRQNGRDGEGQKLDDVVQAFESVEISNLPEA
ncbi:Isoamylase glycoside hydrolase family GH13, Hsp33 [Chondrus crispus]|uniref:Isoamylase glycoside hydrolase family GH13, Hsp33 n=1 Tax=Chondrus crispus TaxID=2769 RepID=R7Q452_CHOCR|nr:Isoamylase glycoside hydrolase family GH13, Hsp33 [Chondrus crispus]CDF32121.1 Isoamylase glycoside hydrolase family GH13, Hsp33 [Chondrus crispus]|eukprot:XP_005711786.1 Isoamylase glycoside hydrolase family GH13, Hsp33 [Chondrus crispus]